MQRYDVVQTPQDCALVLFAQLFGFSGVNLTSSLLLTFFLCVFYFSTKNYNRISFACFRVSFPSLFFLSAAPSSQNNPF
eukprot:m.42580 g.42580  ORF g.42580 m.42580 type:complete len:79 (+) comp17019_c0_seq1:803-1039(+)